MANLLPEKLSESLERVHDNFGHFLSELISACRYASFARTLQLPYEIDGKTIAADLKHGVLTIRLPKPGKGRQARYRVPIT